MRIRLKDERLRRELARSGVSQNRWAQKLGFGSGHFSQLVNGRRPYPDEQTRQRLMEGLGLSFDELFELETPEPRPRPRAVFRPDRSDRPARSGPKGEGKTIDVLAALISEFRHGFRLLLRTPVFALAAVASLALGIGANTAIFSVVQAVLLDPFTYREHERLFLILQQQPIHDDQQRMLSSGPEFEQLRRQSVRLQNVSAVEYVSRNLTAEATTPERVSALKVSGAFFDLLGVPPLHGRAIASQDVGTQGEAVAVISHGLWQRRFGADAGCLGRTVKLDGVSYTLIGIMPAGFRYGGADVWFPFPFDLEKAPIAHRRFSIIGRLAPGATKSQASTELAAIAGRIEAEWGPQHPEYERWSLTLRPLLDWSLGDLRPMLQVLLAASALLLLIACANVANLLLARATRRQREMALRSALGASWGRLARQLLAESGVLVLCGGLAGLLLAWYGLKSVLQFIPAGGLPVESSVSIDLRVLGFTCLLSLLTVFLVGLWPAFQARWLEAASSLSQGRGASDARSTLRTRGFLVVAEVTLAVVLLISAGLLVRTLARLTAVDPGFRSDVLTVRINFPPHYFEPQTKSALLGPVLERLRALPGVEAVELASHPPFSFNDAASFQIEGQVASRESDQHEALVRTVSDGYFELLDIPLLQGRPFGSQDAPGHPPAMIINQAMQRRFWPEGDALGKRIRFQQSFIPDDLAWTVVGIVQDSTQSSLESPPLPEAYLPFAHLESRYRRFNLLLTARNGDPLRFAGAVQEAVWESDRQLPLYEVSRLDSAISESIFVRRLAMLLLGIFAAAGLILAAAGIHGVMSFEVARRRREMGIRMALGASRRNVLGLILNRGARLCLLGTALGLGLAFLVTGTLSSLLYQVSSSDPLTFLGVPLLLSAIGLLSCFLPALSATRTDPVQSLRSE